MSAIFLISCVASKLGRPAAARDLYVSSLFRKARAYVEGTGWPWFVLSAEHGLLLPSQVVSPYEKTLNTMPVAARKAWAEQVLAALEPHLAGVDQVVFLAGHRYREFLEAPLRRRAQVEVPMAGLGIGKQLQWLTQQATRP